jgi:lactam utilization protein B
MTTITVAALRTQLTTQIATLQATVDAAEIALQAQRPNGASYATAKVAKRTALADLYAAQASLATLLPLQPTDTVVQL